MKWLLPNGRIVNKSDKKYRLDFNKKAKSKGAQKVQDFFAKNLPNDVWFSEYTLPSTLLKIDYLNATRKFAVEFQGIQHTRYVKHFHKNRLGYLNSIFRDNKKFELLTLNNYIVLEIEDKDLPLTKQFFEKFNIYF